jgi:hypothetical protein
MGVDSFQRGCETGGWFRPPLAWWRLKATLLALIGRRPGWGMIPGGEAILEHAPPVVAPLTR